MVIHCSAGLTYLRIKANGTITPCAGHETILGEDWKLAQTLSERLCDVCPACRINRPEDYQRTLRRGSDGKIEAGPMSPGNRGQREIVVSVEVIDAKAVAPIAPLISLTQDLAATHNRCWYQLITSSPDQDVLQWDHLGDFTDHLRSIGERLDVVTDLSAKDVRFLELIKKADPDRTWIIARLRSWTRGFDWHKFIGRIVLAKRRGFFTEVHMESQPQQVLLYEKIRDRLLSEGIPVRLLPASGEGPEWLKERSHTMERHSWGLVASDPPKMPKRPVEFEDL